MSFDQALTLLQAVAVIISLSLTVTFSVLNLRKADAAERRTEKDTKILATQLEEIVLALQNLGQATSDAATHRSGVRWTLNWESGDAYHLENTGDEVATKVSIVTHDSLPVFRMPVMPIMKMEPGDSVNFMAVRTMGTKDATISIEYTNLDGETKMWLRALPFRSN